MKAPSSSRAAKTGIGQAQCFDHQAVFIWFDASVVHLCVKEGMGEVWPDYSMYTWDSISFSSMKMTMKITPMTFPSLTPPLGRIHNVSLMMPAQSWMKTTRCSNRWTWASLPAGQLVDDLFHLWIWIFQSTAKSSTFCSWVMFMCPRQFCRYANEALVTSNKRKYGKEDHLFMC